MGSSVRGSGSILKKCDCQVKRTCGHGWTCRWWEGNAQHERTFKDITVNGKRQYGSGKRLAEDFQKKLLDRKAEGQESYTDLKKWNVPFVDYCEAWIARRNSEKTKGTYISALNRIRPALNGKTVMDVAKDRDGAQKLIDSAPASYMLKIRVLLVSPLNEAMKAGMPSHRLRGLDVGKTGRASRANFYFATRGELEALEKELGDLGLIVPLGRLAGLRIGETLGVNINDFREDGTVLRLTRQRNDSGEFAPLKHRDGNDYRDIPVPPELWEKVQEAPSDAQGYLFAADWRSNTLRRFREARDRAGLPGTFTSHDLRHLYASVLLGSGVPISEVSAFLGHQDINVTYSVYGHLVPSAFSRARDVLASEWDEWRQ